jgi:hypothetical protein
MDLSFINLPASQDELLGLLQVAYKAGQDSMGNVDTGILPEFGISISVKTTPKYNFKGWLSRLANQWEDLKHS